MKSLRVRLSESSTRNSITPASASSGNANRSLYTGLKLLALVDDRCTSDPTESVTRGSLFPKRSIFGNPLARTKHTLSWFGGWSTAASSIG